MKRQNFLQHHLQHQTQHILRIRALGTARTIGFVGLGMATFTLIATPQTARAQGGAAKSTSRVYSTMDDVRAAR